MGRRAEGKVALVTGAARGQGRNHALRLAGEGADIIAVDRCADVETAAYAGATRADLDETARQVRAGGRRVVARTADVRDAAALEAAVRDGVAELGRLDVVVANAGIASMPAVAHEMDARVWQETIDINLTGVWRTCAVAAPHLIAGGRGGAMVLTSSVLGLKGGPNLGNYAAAKHGVVGLMRTLANELGPHAIRVNSIHPTQVDTPMIMNDAMYGLFRPDLEAPGREDMAPASEAMHLLPTPWLDPDDVSNAVVFLVSDEARYITGVALPLDAGVLVT